MARQHNAYIVGKNLRIVERVVAATRLRLTGVQRKQANLLHVKGKAQDAAMSGDMELSLSGGDAEDVSADALNAAAAGTFQTMVAVRLQTANADVHRWASLTPVLTPAEFVADADVDVPTIVGTPKFDGGRLLVKLTWDTDADATKTYAPGDSVSLQAQVSASDSLLGYSLSAGGVTKTFNVV